MASYAEEVRRALCGYADNNIRQANRLLDALHVLYGRDNFQAGRFLKRVLARPHFVALWHREPTSEELEAREAIRQMTKFDFTPDNPAHVANIFKLVAGRYDTQRVLLNCKYCGRTEWYLREQWER